MSSKALEWARTHEFESSAVVRTAILRFLAEQADDDGYVPDHEGDKGVAFIIHETCASKSTVIRSLKEFEQADLLHRERRAYADFGGRQTDLIVLHLWNVGTKTPWRTLKALKQLQKSNQARFGVEISEDEIENQPVDNSQNTQGVRMTLRGNSGANTQGVRVTPSRGLGVTLTQARCHSDINDTSALIGTRAQTSPKTSPVSQSVEEAKPVDNSATDRPTENSKKYPAPVSRITRGVNHHELRMNLKTSSGIDAEHISDDVLAHMIHIVFSRATQDVRSPQRFAFSCISKEFYELVSLAESVIEHKQPQQKPRIITCPIHHVEHPAERECPAHRADRLAGVFN